MSVLVWRRCLAARRPTERAATAGAAAAQPPATAGPGATRTPARATPTPNTRPATRDLHTHARLHTIVRARLLPSATAPACWPRGGGASFLRCARRPITTHTADTALTPEHTHKTHQPTTSTPPPRHAHHGPAGGGRGAFAGPLQQPPSPLPQPPPGSPPQAGQFSTTQLRVALWLLTGGLAYVFFNYVVVVSPAPPPGAAMRHAVEEEFRRDSRMTVQEAREAQARAQALANDPLADHKLPALIKEHRRLSFLRRLWFYLRLAARGTVLTVLWIPVFTMGLVLPTRTWMRLVTHSLEWSGPVFIKLGQWASTRPDLFPEEVCSAMTRLQAEVASHQFQVSMRTCEANFGPGLERDGMKLVLEERVVGSGSMGQVHHGYIEHQATGERQPVAIKVLHPHIHSHVNRDLTLLYYVTSVLTKIPYSELQWLAIPEMLIQFTGFMSSHLDLQQEARNMDRFREYFAKDPNILFPQPMYPFVGEQVLTQTLAQGIPLGRFLHGKDHDRAHMDDDPRSRTIAERIIKAHIQRHEEAVREAQKTGASIPLPPLRSPPSPLHSEVARLGLQMYLHMLIRDNFVHSDLHPGNILVQLPGLSAGGFDGDVEDLVHQYDDASSEFLKSRHVNLVILDSGLVSELNRKNRKNFLSLFGALILRDGRLAARLMLADAPRHACTDPVQLQEDMHAIVSAIPLENLGRVDLGQLLSEVMNTVRRHHVKLESDFASLVISLAIIEGIGRQLDPDMSLFHEAVPVMLKDRDTRNILLETAGVRACAQLGLVLAKEEYHHLQEKL